MNIMRLLVPCLTLAMVLGQLAAEAQTPTLSAASAASLTDYLTQAVDHGDVPGVVPASSTATVCCTRKQRADCVSQTTSTCRQMRSSGFNR